MLKIRMQGTISDIKWFREIMERHKEVNLQEISKPYANKGTSKYYRVYAEVEKEENNGGK